MRRIAHERYSSFGDYTDLPVKVVETDKGLEVYFQREIGGKPRAGGSPTALLEKNNCRLLDLYMTQ
jgi:hypothetical protein